MVSAQKSANWIEIKALDPFSLGFYRRYRAIWHFMDVHDSSIVIRAKNFNASRHAGKKELSIH